MRHSRLIFPILVALAAAACSRQQAASYVRDPATGEMVPVVQRYGEADDAQSGTQAQAQAQSSPQAQSQPQYTGQVQAQSAQTDYQQPDSARTAPHGRGLFTSGLFSRHTQVAQADAQNDVAPAAAETTSPVQSFVMQYQPPARAARAQRLAQAPHATQTRQAPQTTQSIPASRRAGQDAAYAYAPAAPLEGPYTLGAGDKLRVVVFGQTGISGEYLVDAQGNVTLPLIGSVPARGRSTGAVAHEIASQLKRGYVRQPHVTVSVSAYRPFFILGEVTTPGQYPYVPNMTAENAVAIAGGFSPRAYKDTVEITRNLGAQQSHQRVPLGYPLRPGDTVVVKERWF